MTVLAFMWLYLALPLNVLSTSKKVVIGSFKVAGEKATDEYVELLNVSTESINITGWQLARKSSGGTKYNLVSSFPSAEIRPGESLVAGHKDSTNKPDIFYSTASSVSGNGSIIIYSDQGKTVADLVGFGEASEYEGHPLPEPGTDVWRRNAGVDTDDNLSDFKKVISSKDYSGLCLSEIMPDPKEGEEWIEIYNSEITKDIGGLIIADKLGAIKKYVVPEGTIAKEGGYVVFKKTDTGITLNNDDDGVVLTDGSGKTFDDSGNYGKSKKGFSFASDGQKWAWTARVTPGSGNVITDENTAMIYSKKRTANDSFEAVDSKKGTLPKGEVLGSSAAKEDDIFAERNGSDLTDKDRLLGYILIAVALTGGFLYTLVVNRERLIEIFNKERRGYRESWQKFVGKYKNK